MKKKLCLLLICSILFSFIVPEQKVYASEGIQNLVQGLENDIKNNTLIEEKDKGWFGKKENNKEEEKKKDKWKWPWEEDESEEENEFYGVDSDYFNQFSSGNQSLNTQNNYNFSWNAQNNQSFNTQNESGGWLEDLQEDFQEIWKKFLNDTGENVGDTSIQTLSPNLYLLLNWGDALANGEEVEETESKSLGDIMWDNWGAPAYYSSKWSDYFAEKATDPIVDVYQNYLGDYFAKKYHKKGITGEVIGGLTDIGTNFTDASSTLFEMGKIALSDDVDKSLQIYEKSFNLAEPMVNMFCQAFGVPEETFAAPLFVFDGLSGAWEELRKTPEYQVWKSQFRTEKGFKDAFWDMTWEGIAYCLADIPRELGLYPRVEVHSGYVYIDTGNYWDYIFKTVKKKDGSITISFTDYQVVPSGRVPVYKPNIYFYAEEKMESDVVFLQENLLTETIPVYQNGWHINVLGDGKIVWEQQEFDFLFYESLTDKTLNQYKDGWYISYEKREEALNAVLELYQFNEQETKDFMEFWLNKLEENQNYMMYPQETECVDCQMPMNISPAPDNIRRIWFGFEEVTEAKENVAEPEVHEIERDGFTVVEWGGFLLDK